MGRLDTICFRLTIRRRRGLALHAYRLGYDRQKCTLAPRGNNRYNTNNIKHPNSASEKYRGSIPNGPNGLLLIVKVGKRAVS